MGLQHGKYCLGCCWILMALLFVLGVMNLVWIAALAAFVLLEKIIPGGAKVSKLPWSSAGRLGHLGDSSSSILTPRF
ncbi:MAG: hypothetical protein CM1200mP22_26910 [Dehalococcoidia bacterium]|nr:MAG: hypothetical protein CM1200mP22_26910 [Dehalococcoidia bacterium]